MMDIDRISSTHTTPTPACPIVDMKGRTHHIRIIRVEPKLRKRIQPSHEPKTHRSIQLCKWVVGILPRLHRRQLLRC